MIPGSYKGRQASIHILNNLGAIVKTVKVDALPGGQVTIQLDDDWEGIFWLLVETACERIPPARIVVWKGDGLLPGK